MVRMGRRTLEHIQTNPTQLVDIWMIYFCEKSYLWWRHWIVFGKEQLKFEDATYTAG